jgi:hypothetical protein
MHTVDLLIHQHCHGSINDWNFGLPTVSRLQTNSLAWGVPFDPETFLIGVLTLRSSSVFRTTTIPA